MRKSMELLAVTGLSVVAVLGTSACSGSGYEVDTTQPSRVESLTFTPEHEEDGLCLVSVKTGEYTSVCVLYDQVTVEDVWEMRIAQCEDGLPPIDPNSRPKEGVECSDVRRDISEEEFDALNVGDVVTVNDDGNVVRIPQ